MVLCKRLKSTIAVLLGCMFSFLMMTNVFAAETVAYEKNSTEKISEFSFSNTKQIAPKTTKAPTVKDEHKRLLEELGSVPNEKTGDDTEIIGIVITTCIVGFLGFLVVLFITVKIDEQA